MQNLKHRIVADWMIYLLFFFVHISIIAQGVLLDFESLGAIADDTSYETAWKNCQIFNNTVNSLKINDVFFIPNKTFTLVGGIKASGLKMVTFQIDGTLSFTNDRDTWPKKVDGKVEECFYLENVENIIFTSSGKGTLNGNGQAWWGAIKYLVHSEDRPRLLHIKTSRNLLVENLLLKDSPYWSFYSEKTDGMVARYVDVDVRWTNASYHTLIDLQAFNTDGIDVTGTNVHIHDCNIWCQDDCISVKGGSSNMLFERNMCSGLGFVVGSIGSSQVKNITFKDSWMPSTYKGIYMKTRWSDDAPIGENASISNILFENITMDSPQQYAIWIGPAQQSSQPCSLLWPRVDKATCIMSGYQTWSNIVLRNIFIRNPDHSPGLIYGNVSNPMTNLIFDNVVVLGAGDEPFGDNYFCQGVSHAYAIGKTTPVPPCFQSTLPAGFVLPM